MIVKPFEKSPTMFLVSSRSLQCTRCTRRYGEDKQAKFDLKVGGDCPHGCGKTLRRVLPYHIDLVEVFPIGRCGCPQGQNKAAAARRLKLQERLQLDHFKQDELRCVHLKAARSFALNRDLSHYEKERMSNREY